MKTINEMFYEQLHRMEERVADELLSAQMQTGWGTRPKTVAGRRRIARIIKSCEKTLKVIRSAPNY